MAYSFIAANAQRLYGPDNSNLDITGPITVSIWCKASGENIDSVRGLVSKWSVGQRSYEIGYSAVSPATASKVNALISSNGAYQENGSVLDTTTNIGTDWIALAMVYVPSTLIATYIGGSPGTSSSSNVPSAIFSGTANLEIAAAFAGNWSTFFGGLIGSTAIWSAALTVAEISSLAKGFSPRRIRPQSLVFYAPLVRNLQDLRNGLALTADNSPTVANHPRVY